MSYDQHKSSKVSQYGYTFNPEQSFPRLSIRPSYFVSYLHYNSRSGRRSHSDDNTGSSSRTTYVCICCHCLLPSELVAQNIDICNSCANLADNTQKGNISKSSGTRLRTYIDWLILLSKNKKAYNERSKSWYNFKLALLTVKLPCQQIHDDNFLKSHLLNNLLTQIRTKYHVNYYVWKAEKGNDEIIHWHILHDAFIPHKEINKIWNKILDSYGYIEIYRNNQKNWHKNGFKFRDHPNKKWNLRAQVRAYKEGLRTNWSCPTGTSDIHAMRKIRNTQAYLSKYFSKSFCVEKKLQKEIQKIEQETGTTITDEDSIKTLREEIESKHKVEGNLWYVSQPLSALKSITCDITTSIDDLLQNLYKTYPSRFYESKFCRIFKFDIMTIISQNFTPLIEPIKAAITDIRSKYYPLKNNLYSILGIPIKLESF